MFARIFRTSEQKEILINVNSIWKIEVTYIAPDSENKNFYQCTLKDGINNPNAIRSYKIFFGSEEAVVLSDPDDPVINVFEDIYNNAIKK